ncbi:MAG: PEGA domain-containing protein, partial [Deltaproteobacteria bacterium]|nr:PEGA domain-containing protein [Kofleriaceae bacterium]
AQRRASSQPPPVMITVEVISKPAGADVYLDDKLVGRTPLRVEVPQSSTELNLKVMRKGYADQVVSFTAEADQSLEVKLVKPAKRPRGLGTIGVGGSGSGGGKGVGRGFILS